MGSDTPELASAPFIDRRETTMPCGNMMMGGAGGAWMMIAMSIIWLLTIVLLVLGIAALLKYLRSDRRPRQ